MTLKMEYHLKWNVTKTGMSLQNGMSLKMECHSNEISLEWIVTQN